MIDWLLAWWPILIIYVSVSLLSSWVGLLYQWIDRRLDDAVPDDRTKTTEEWVDGKLDELGLVAEVDLGRWGPVAMRTSNAFLPWSKSIALADITAGKKDATFWIVGAHELGHAIWHRRFPLLSRWALGARGSAGFAWNYFLTLMLVNTLWGWSLVSDLMLVRLITYQTLTTVVLVDEALASLSALQLVKGDEFTPLEQRAMRTKLLAAFGTYFTQAVPAGLLAVGWSTLRAFLEAGQDWAKPIDPNHEWWVGVAAAGFLVIVGGLGALWARASWRSDKQDEDADDDDKIDWRALIIAAALALALVVLATAFWFLTFDRPHGDGFRVALLFGAPLGWFLPGLAISVGGLIFTYPVGKLRDALGLSEDVQTYADQIDESNSELGELLDDIDLSPEGQERLLEEEAKRKARLKRKKRDPKKPYERRKKRKRKRGRINLDDAPDGGSLRFWLLQVNPIWLLPAIGMWLAL